MAKRTSIINFKGGVGKTTLAFHLATGLVRFHGQKVLLVDMDHQSSLSILVMRSRNWEAAVNSEKTVRQVFLPFISHAAMPTADIVTASPLAGYRELDILPSCLALDDTEIELTASHHGNAIQSEWDKRTLISRWLEETGVDAEYDHIIFDCPPATKIVSQNAIASSHAYIIPVVPEAVIERGAPHLMRLIETGIDRRLNALAAMGSPRRMHVPDTTLAGLAVTRIRTAGGYSGYTNDHTQHLNSLRGQWGDRLIQPYILDGTGVAEALTDGVPVYDRAHTQNVGGRQIHLLYEQLVGALKAEIDAA